MDNYILVWSSFVLLFVLVWFCTRYSKPSQLCKHKSILVLVAHPDDECMFFGPIICSILSHGVQVDILSVSNGNWYGQGTTRVKEFYSSCSALGVPAQQCHIMDDPLLQDNHIWDQKYLLQVITKFLSNKSFDAIITFDEFGVSNHANHISLYHAVDSLDLPSLSKYKLTTVNMVRKYSSCLDFVTSYLLGESGVVLSLTDLHKPYKAMFSHRSQLLWFRYLYLLFSRYMLLNTIEEI